MSSWDFVDRTRPWFAIVVFMIDSLPGLDLANVVPNTAYGHLVKSFGCGTALARLEKQRASSGEEAGGMVDWEQVFENLAALGVAAGLGGVVGFEREVHGRWAGWRTHILVSVGAAMFVSIGASTPDAADLGRVIQG